MDNLFLFLNKTENAPVVDTPSIVNTENESVVKTKKKYDQKKYNNNFMEKNKDKIKLKIVCDVCCGSYTYYNKSKHMKSKKHLNLLNKQNQ